MTKPKPTYDPKDCPTVWFAVLDRARQMNDFERAAEAIRELRRLGVFVQFQAKGADHAR